MGRAEGSTPPEIWADIYILKLNQIRKALIQEIGRPCAVPCDHVGCALARQVDDSRSTCCAGLKKTVVLHMVGKNLPASYPIFILSITVYHRHKLVGR